MVFLMRGRRAELLVASAMTAYLLLCPFAKVEESFNLQATHDLLLLGVRGVDQFDHLEFPGVVPRTFIGSLAVAGASRPLVWLLQLLGVHKLWLQVATRWVLGMLTMGASSSSATAWGCASVGTRVASCCCFARVSSTCCST